MSDDLIVTTLTKEAFQPFGWVLGMPFPGSVPAAAFASAGSDFWHVHDFDCGAGGGVEVLWVACRDSSAEIGRLEVHHVTQQALIPLTGPVIQIVAASAADGSPDEATLTAFHVMPGQGLCMRPGCWHTTRVSAGEALCAMLTRRSTTLDLVQHLRSGAVPGESTLLSIQPRRWRWSASAEP